MFTFSLTVCKRLITPRCLRLICSSARKSQIITDKLLEDLGNDSRFAPDYTRPGVTFATKYINECNNLRQIRWDDLTKKLEEMEVPNPSTKILQACIRLDNLDLGMSYYSYLMENRVDLSVLDLVFFSKLLLIRKSEIKKYETVIEELYHKIKDTLASSLLIRNFVLAVFAEVPSCFHDLINTEKSASNTRGNLPLLYKALELDMPDVAAKYTDDDDFVANRVFLEQYINFCIRMIERGKFTKDHINNLVDICDRKLVTLSHENALVPLGSLVSALRKHDDGYHWSVTKSTLSENHVCSNCGLTLLPNTITNEEFESLRENFFKQAFLEKNLFLNTTKVEMNSFLKFLKRCGPYNMVIDGLNMMYRQKSLGTLKQNLFLKYVLDKGFKALTIGRVHSKENLTKAPFLKQSKYKGNYQFFFTQNVSDDDLFLLHATLHGGPNTFFLTGDHHGTYAARLDSESQYKFLKWKLSHQFLILSDYTLAPPMPHCGLSQLTLNTKDKYVWHLSQQNCDKATVSNAYPIKWYCLTAEKKRENKKGRKINKESTKN